MKVESTGCGLPLLIGVCIWAVVFAVAYAHGFWAGLATLVGIVLVGAAVLLGLAKLTEPPADKPDTDRMW